MHAAGDDAVPKGIRRDDASAARPKKKSSADATQTPPLARAASVEEEVTGRKGSSPPPLVRTPSNVPSISEDEWGGGEDDEGIEEIDGGGVPLSPMAEEDEGSWGDEGAPDVMMTFDGENWVPRRSSFDASSI